MTNLSLPLNPKIGLSIGTYASPGYVHLQLESVKRFNPEVKVLVHDDCSPVGPYLRKLCEEYDADFTSTESQRVPTVGDMGAFAAGLRWSTVNNLDITVKISRRFILAKPWANGLIEIFQNMQYPTVSGACAWYGFGFRSELVAMHTKSWVDAGILTEMEGLVVRNELFAGLPECWYHQRSREVLEFIHRPNVNALSGGYVHDINFDPLVRYEAYYPTPETCNGFAKWPIMGLHRHQPIIGTLWHDVATAREYWQLSQLWGLPYSCSDFESPNSPSGSCY